MNRSSTCINLCEILSITYEKDSTYETIIDTIMTAKEMEQCNRVYIGSSFCSQYFLYIKEEEIYKLVYVLSKRNMSLTLVLPIFTQKNLEKGKVKVKRILEISNEVCDEITVNDYGMLEYISKTYTNRINLGRLFMKDYRDPRHEDYFLQTYHTKYFTNTMKKILKDYRILTCEWDMTHEVVDITSAPENIIIGIHRPYSYMTVGQICEIGSISKDVAKKYRPNEPCKKECETHLIKYEFDMEKEWMKFGRAVYYKNDDSTYITNNDTRTIYFPLKEVLS